MGTAVATGDCALDGDDGFGRAAVTACFGGGGGGGGSGWALFPHVGVEVWAAVSTSSSAACTMSSVGVGLRWRTLSGAAVLLPVLRRPSSLPGD